MMNTQMARHNMIDGQLEPNQVTDPRIIAALGVTPREQFVPEIYAANAYVDDNIPLGSGRFLMQPVALGRLLQAAQIEVGTKVLVVAGNTGYSAAVLAQLGCQVTMVEEQRELADRARRILSDMGVRQVEILTAALHSGDPAHAPYEVILIDGAVEIVPDALKQQLAEGGRLVTLVAAASGPEQQGVMARAVLLQRLQAQFAQIILFDAAVPVIPALKAHSDFTL